MSHHNNLYHRLMALRAEQMVAAWKSGRIKTLNINALDDLDPVHYRAQQNPEREFDHDGDMGREHQDYMRDNGIGSASATLATIGSWQQIADLSAEASAKADALPVIEAPSIVASLPVDETVEAENAKKG